MGLFRRRERRAAPAPVPVQIHTASKQQPPPPAAGGAAKPRPAPRPPGKENAGGPAASNTSIVTAAAASAAAAAAAAAPAGKRRAKRQQRQADKAAAKSARKAAAAGPAGGKPKHVLIHKPVAAEKAVTTDRRRSVKIAAPVCVPGGVGEAAPKHSRGPSADSGPSASSGGSGNARRPQQTHQPRTRQGGDGGAPQQRQQVHPQQQPKLSRAATATAALQSAGSGTAARMNSSVLVGSAHHIPASTSVPILRPHLTSGQDSPARPQNTWPHRDLAAALEEFRIADADHSVRRIAAVVPRETPSRDKMVFDGLPASLIAFLKHDAATMEMRRTATSVLADLSVQDKYEPPLVEAGVVPILVWLMNPKNMDDEPILTMACRGLRNLLGGTQPTAVQAARYGCVEPLLSIIDGRAGYGADSDLVLEAAAAIANLAHHGSRFKSYIIKHQGLEALTSLGKRTKNDEALFHVVNVLAEFALEAKWHRAIITADALPAAFRALDIADDPDVVAEAGRLVGNVAVTQKNRSAVRDAGGLVALLQRLAQCATFSSIVPAFDLTRAIATVCTDPKSASDALSASDGTTVLLRVYSFPDAPAQLVGTAMRALQVLAQGSANRRAKVLYAVGIQVKQAALAGKPTNRLYDLRQAILDDSRAEGEAGGMTSVPMPETLERLSRASVRLMKSGVLIDGAGEGVGVLSSGGGSVRYGQRANDGARPGAENFQDHVQADVKRRTGGGPDRSKFRSTGRVMSVTRKARQPGQHGSASASRHGHEQQQFGRQPTDLRQLAAQTYDDDEVELANGHEQKLSSGDADRARMLAEVTDGDMSKELFEIGQVLGKGGYGSVMLAKNLRTDELVAIKSFHNSGAMVDKKAIKEQRVWKGLHHENVVEFKGSFVGDNGNLNLVVEYVDGLSLAEHLAQYSAFPETLVAEIARQVLCGIEYLHAKGVTHRDLKPANILVDNNAAVKICDFGVSCSENVQTINPGQQHMVGTPWYIAPELIEYRPYTKSVDIWSLGCTIMELATGRRPYHELAAMQVLFRMVEDQMPPIPSHLSPELRNFLKSCFVWDPEQRPSASQLMQHPFIQKAKKFASGSAAVSARHQ